MRKRKKNQVNRQPMTATAVAAEIKPVAAVKVEVRDDAALMASVCAGERTALMALYERYAPMIHAVCAAMLDDDEQAEECMVDVFTDLWKQREQLDRRVAALSYLLGQSRSAAMTRRVPITSEPMAIRGPSVMSREEEAWPRYEPENAPFARERNEMRAALNRLEPAQREVVELWCFNGLTDREIEIRLGKATGAVQADLRQGLIRLRDVLRDEMADGA